MNIRSIKQANLLFNHETCEGADMAIYNGVTGKGGTGDQTYLQEKNIGGLLAGRDGRLVGKSKQVESADDFDLVTWLVIK